MNLKENKRNIVLTLLVLILCCLTACHKTPTTTVINNQKETDSDITISEQTTLEPEENMVYVTLTEETIKETVVVGDNTVVISGVIIKPDRLDGLYQYIAYETDYSEYEKNMMFLFGEHEKDAYRDERSKNIIAKYGENQYARIINSRLYDVNNFTGPMGAIWYHFNFGPVSESERKVNMTLEEATTKADEIMSRIGVKDIVYYNSEYHEEILLTEVYGDDICPMGDTIGVYYVQQLQGIPVISFNHEKYLAPVSAVGFHSKGIETVSVVEYQYERIRRIDQCISYEQALEEFRKYISENEKYTNVPFTEVSFEYALWKESVNGSRVLVAKPCWAFKVHEDVIGYDDIYVDAETGEVVERQK